MLDAGFSTLDYLKSRILPDAGIEETQWDTALGKLGLSIAARMQAHTARRFERGTAHVDEFSAWNLSVTLKSYPVETIASVQIRETDGTLTTQAASTYALDKGAGLLTFYTVPGTRLERIVVTYAGGFWLDPLTGATLPTGATALPDDLLETWISEIQIEAEARNLFGAIALRKDFNKSKTRSGLDESTVEALRPYRRFSGE